MGGSCYNCSLAGRDHAWHLLTGWTDRLNGCIKMGAFLTRKHQNHQDAFLNYRCPGPPSDLLSQSLRGLNLENVLPMNAPQGLRMQSPILKNHGYFCICKSRQQNFRTATWKPPGKGTTGMCSVIPAGLLIQLRNCCHR